ncbi:hypothetical protein MY3296_009396 [Beauveria thailandica]
MLPTIDNKFGPVLPGKFDFTLLFELVMLGMVPAGIIILLMPFYLGRMLIATHKIRPGPLLWFKLANGTALIAVQLASIISWQKAGLYRSDVSLAASVMSFIASLCVVGLLYISHTFSLHQSSFLSIYLSATMLFDMAMARSYFLRGSLDSLGALQATIAVLKFTLAMIEEIPKHDPFHSSPFRLGPAERGGFWGRALLLWVNPILRLGFAKDFTVDELPHIGDRYESELLFDQFIPIWNKVAAMGTYIVTKKMASARTAWNAKVDSRVAAASNVLAQLKSIKAMGLTDAMSTYLQEKRLDEIETSMIERNCRIIIYGIYGFGAAMTPVAVLAGARFWTRASNPMSVSETFAAYAAIFIAALPLNSLLGHLPYYARENEAEKPEKDEALHDQPSKYAVTMNNVSVNSDFSGPILKDVTLRVPTGSLVMMHGLVSSGKSAFLKTIMGELSVDTGTLQVASKTIAYTSQTPWIRNATIKDNIIGPYPFAEEVYNEVVFACALDKDMADLPDGDNSMAGSYGCNLSGGQKQRLGLARSLFARTSIILLDNILSALDADTAKLVFTRVCGRNGLLRRRNSTAIMTTNQPELLEEADIVFEISHQGRVRQKKIKSRTESARGITANAGEETPEPETDVPAASEEFEPPSVDLDGQVPETNKLDKDRRHGDLTLYAYFFRTTHCLLFVTWFVVTAIAAVMERMPQTSLGGLARIQSFCKDTPVEQDGVDMPALPENWPSSGKIDFNCVTAKYTGPQGEAYEALKNTTVSIQHGQRVRVSGRTGSGKTSMMLALLNLIEFSGSINIDGLSIKMIPRHVLRSSITTMTQDGVELKGTIRINIFPFALTPPTDAEIIATLERVGLWVHIHRQGGLESDMSKSHFSHGQKQLLFLARAILHQQVKQTKIILVDEATSSLDSTTDENMRQLMAEAFTDCTVITIAHQRDYAAEMDIVMELDSGNLSLASHSNDDLQLKTIDHGTPITQARSKALALAHGLVHSNGGRMIRLLGLALVLLDPTEAYEYFIITAIPAGISILFTPILNDNVPQVVPIGEPALASTKLTVSCAMLIAQAVNLAIWCYGEPLYSLQTIFAAVLSFFASLSVVGFLQFSRRYAFPSITFHNIFLTTTLLYDLAMMRHTEKSLGSIGFFQFATVTLKFFYLLLNFSFQNPILVLQPRLLEGQEADAPSLPSIWSCLSWPGLVSVPGNVENCDLKDLPEPAWRLCSEAIFRQFKVQWNSVSARSILIAAIYDKMMRVSAMDIQGSTALSHLMDGMRSIEILIVSTQDVASAVFQVLLGICLLWSFIGNASLLIFVPTTLVALGSFLSGKQELHRRNLVTERRKSRVALTSSILKQLQSIKMMGLGPALAMYLNRQRRSEVDALLDERGSRMQEFSLLAFSHSMTPILVIAGYVTVSTAFNVAVDYLSCGQQGKQILGRIQEFLLLDELVDKRLVTDAAEDDSEDSSLTGATPTVELVHVTVMSKTGEVILLDATLRAFQYGMTMIFGPVACGKSAVLRLILGEVAPSSGRIAVSSGLMLPDDDMTVIDGPIGRLSVSMKQRISLARAVYDRPTTIVLDDPLNAVQYNMASQIYENLFGDRGLVFSWECTVIMATNNFGHLQFADALFTVGYDGRVKSQIATTYRSAANTRALLQDSNGLFSFPPTSEEAPESRLHPQPEEPDERDKIATQGQDASLSSYFQQPAGKKTIRAWYMAVAAAAIMEKMPEIFWGLSLSDSILSPTYVAGYAAFGVANVLCNRMAAHHYLTRISTKSSIELHWRLIKTVIMATPEFVSNANIASMLKLFDQDLETISRELPSTLMQRSFVIISLTLDALIISCCAKYTVAFIIALWALIYRIRSQYLPFAQRLRLLETQALAGVTVRCSETAAGIEHIRAFQQQSAFYQDFHGALTLSQKPYYYVFEAQRQLEYTIAIFTTAVGLAVISLTFVYPQSSSPARLGLALVSIVELPDKLNSIADIWAKLDESLGTVFRIRKFCCETPIEVDEAEEPLPPKWPSKGAFDFFRVATENDGVDVDKASTRVPLVDASLQGTQKIVVSSRTGSRQPSLILAALRIINYSGAIRLDDVNIKNIPRVVLRSSITTITREGLELEGTLRSNLDPLSMLESYFSDADLISMLHRVKLWDAVQRRGGLDASMKRMRLSKAQTQLLSLARGALHRRREDTKVVLIDDAITHLDGHTRKDMYDFIDGEFATCTVLMVAYDLEAIRTADTVITVEGGAITGVLERADSE